LLFFYVILFVHLQLFLRRSYPIFQNNLLTFIFILLSWYKRIKKSRRWIGWRRAFHQRGTICTEGIPLGNGPLRS